MAIAALAWNIKAWFAMMMHRKADRHDYTRMEFHRFFHGVVLIPAMVLRRSLRSTVRLVGYTPALDRLFSAGTTIERLRLGGPHPQTRHQTTAADPRRRPRTREHRKQTKTCPICRDQRLHGTAANRRADTHTTPLTPRHGMSTPLTATITPDSLV